MTGQLLFLPCAGGVEELLADEIAALLPAAKPQRLRGGVQLAADAATAMRLNLESRLAQRVLWRVAEGGYRGEDDLYVLARRVRWQDWITLRVKDAVCDQLREALGARPDVDTRHPHLSLVLHLDEDHASLYVDLSGEALFKRGWRDAAKKKGGSRRPRSVPNNAQRV